MHFKLIYPLMLSCSMTLVTCGPSGAESETDSPSSSGTATEPTMVTNTGAATEPTTVTDSGLATDTSTGNPTTTDEPVDPACAAPPDQLSGPSWPDGYMMLPSWTGFLDEPCVLEATEAQGIGLKLILDCPQQEQELGQETFEIVITAGPIPVLPPIGATIDAHGEFVGIDISNDGQTVILRSEGKLLYAAVRALRIDPKSAGPEIYAPLVLSRADHCPLEPFIEGDTSSPVGDGFICERGARAQLRVSTVGSEDLLLVDGEVAMIAAGQTTYAVDVRRAWQMENCAPDHPQGVLDFVGFAIAAQ